MVRSPYSEGVLCFGIPSPLIRIVCPGLVTPVRFTWTVCPSRCLKDVSKPRRAARSGIVILMASVSRERLNVGWPTLLSLRTTSPGIWPGFCSDSYLKTISSPSGIPFSIVAVSVFSSRLHRSFDSTITSCCTTMPGPARRCTIFFSLGQGPHARQRSRWPLFLQLRQTVRRLIVAAFSLPLYMSSRVTGISISMFLPLPVSRCCPPPKNMSNGDPPCCCPSRPLRAIPIPPWSYSTRLSLSDRISYASVTSWKRIWASSFSFLPPVCLSGWYLTESFRYADLISRSLASGWSPSRSYRSTSSSSSSGAISSWRPPPPPKPPPKPPPPPIRSSRLMPPPPCWNWKNCALASAASARTRSHASLFIGALPMCW
mmetsp:Transcript_35056/g.60033  ORF Transcript_35056/g.60033 Transcript_35056/m.60033 type:complete len:372 (-) Transcript_35056:13-1128(-)